MSILLRRFAIAPQTSRGRELQPLVPAAGPSRWYPSRWSQPLVPQPLVPAAGPSRWYILKFGPHIRLPIHPQPLVHTKIRPPYPATNPPLKDLAPREKLPSKHHIIPDSSNFCGDTFDW
jgi:hypothetical protein